VTRRRRPAARWPPPPREQLCPSTALQLSEGAQPTAQQLRAAQDDPRCASAENGYNSRFSDPVVGSYDEFVRLTGLRSEAARRALAAGGMVVFSPLQVRNGQGVRDVTDHPMGSGAPTSPAAHPVSVPAAYVDAGGKRFLQAFVSPAVAQRVGVAPVLQPLVLQYATPPDDNTEERVRAELAKLGDQYVDFQVERGYRDRYGIGLLALLLASAVITLGAAGIATGLAQADARADRATLAAIGSPPRVRRSLAAWQAANRRRPGRTARHRQRLRADDRLPVRRSPDEPRRAVSEHHHDRTHRPRLRGRRRLAAHPVSAPARAPDGSLSRHAADACDGRSSDTRLRGHRYYVLDRFSPEKHVCTRRRAPFPNLNNAEWHEVCGTFPGGAQLWLPGTTGSSGKRD